MQRTTRFPWELCPRLIWYQLNFLYFQKGEFEAGAEHTTDYTRKKAQSFKEKTESQVLYFTGRPPPRKPEEKQQWLDDIQKEPLPLKIT